MTAPPWIALEQILWLACRLDARQQPIDFGRFQLILFHVAWTRAMTQGRTFGCSRWLVQDQVPWAVGLIMALTKCRHVMLTDVEAACNRRSTTVRALIGNRFILDDPGLEADLDPRLNFIIAQSTERLLGMARETELATLTRHGETVDLQTFARRRRVGRNRSGHPLGSLLCR